MSRLSLVALARAVATDPQSAQKDVLRRNREALRGAAGAAGWFGK